VDVGAFGKLSSESESKVYLFSVKSGDLDRRDWDGKPQDLRPSINEIKISFGFLSSVQVRLMASWLKCLNDTSGSSIIASDLRSKPRQFFGNNSLR
jgi:hypothetical protein